jgi:hypothetical protein
MKLAGIAFLINLIIFRVRNRWTICVSLVAHRRELVALSDHNWLNG